MKIAIVHDYLNQYGGAERVVEALHDIFPEAPIYTSIFVKENMPVNFQNMDIRTSFMQKFPFINYLYRFYLLFYPKAIESFNLKGYDIIISSSSAFAKGAIKDSDSLHFCYCYTPMRFVWDYKNYMAKEDLNIIIKKILPLVIRHLKKWELKTINRVDYYIGISKNISERIKRIYNVDAEYLYPPVKTSQFKISDKIEDFFLIVSRLSAYKNIDLAIRVFNKIGLPLKIVGTGSSKKYLEKLATSKLIEFLGRASEEELINLYSKCRAYIFPGSEDFGISTIEAQASGRPVIAFAAGGALETIIENKTGIFFRENSEESLTQAISRFMEIEKNFSPQEIREHTLKFDSEIFKNKFKFLVYKKYKEYIDIKMKYSKWKGHKYD